MSLLDAAERFAAMDRSAIVLDPARCLHSLDRASTCEACFQICPVEAITPGKPPSLDADKCESCLACLVICPVGAYNADDAVRPLLNAVTRLEGQTLELVCAKNPQPEKGISESGVGIRVKGCLAGLGTGTYLALAALGLERVVARTEACSACEWANLRPQIDSQIERAARVLAGWDKGETVTSSSASDGLVERTVWDAENPPLSRRDLFRMMARQGQVAMARAMENGEHSIGRKPGRDRVRALGAVAHLDAPLNGSFGALDGLNFATVTISEACTACSACGRACPTEALKFEKSEDNASFALKFSARDCIGCDLCVRVCLPAAVSVDHAPTFAQVFGEEQTTLCEGELVKCERCGSLMAKRGEARLCDLCEYRRAHPFGSVMPPGFNSNQFKVPETRQ